MYAVFADTCCWISLLNPRDQTCAIAICGGNSTADQTHGKDCEAHGNGIASTLASEQAYRYGAEHIRDTG
jgi:hypothetical protein